MTSSISWFRDNLSASFSFCITVRSYRGGEKDLCASQIASGNGKSELGIQRFGKGVLWFPEATGGEDDVRVMGVPTWEHISTSPVPRGKIRMEKVHTVKSCKL